MYKQGRIVDESWFEIWTEELHIVQERWARTTPLPVHKIDGLIRNVYNRRNFWTKWDIQEHGRYFF
jgi:hypothetical protein